MKKEKFYEECAGCSPESDGIHIIDVRGLSFKRYLDIAKLTGCKVAVIGQQKHSGGVAVKTTYGIYALGAGSLDDVHHRSTTVGIVAGGDAVFGLVEQDIAFAFECHYLVVVFDYVAMAYLGTQFGHYIAVDLDKSLLDVFIGFATRAYARIGHEFVQTNLFVGIGYRHFVLYALGTRSEALALARERIVFLVVTVLAFTLIVVSALLGTIIVFVLAVIVVIAALLVVAALLTIGVAVAALLTIGIAVAALIVVRLRTIVVVRTRSVSLLWTLAFSLTLGAFALCSVVVVVRTVESAVVLPIVTALLGTIIGAIGTLFVVFYLCIVCHGTTGVLTFQCHARFADTRTFGSFFVVFHLFLLALSFFAVKPVIGVEDKKCINSRA